VIEESRRHVAVDHGGNAPVYEIVKVSSHELLHLLGRQGRRHASPFVVEY
jgi:hypothetical protein